MPAPVRHTGSTPASKGIVRDVYKAFVDKSCALSRPLGGARRLLVAVAAAAAFGSPAVAQEFTLQARGTLVASSRIGGSGQAAVSWTSEPEASAVAARVLVPPHASQHLRVQSSADAAECNLRFGKAELRGEPVTVRCVLSLQKRQPEGIQPVTVRLVLFSPA